MSDYNIQLVKKQKMVKSGQTRSHFNITKTKDRMISIEDVDKIYKSPYLYSLYEPHQ
jgi:hypothetical protein